MYSRTFCKGPPKMSSLGGRLLEVVEYKSLDHNGSKFFLELVLGTA